MKSNRNAAQRRRIGPHTRLTQVWSAIVLSLPLDAVWVFVPHAPLAEEYAQRLAILCALITLPFLNQTRVTSLLSHLRATGRDPKRGNARLIQVMILLVFVLIAGAKLLVLPSLSSLLGALCGGIVILGLFRGAQRARQHQRQQAKELQDSPWLAVTLWEKQAVVVGCIPLIAARFVSLFGSLSLDGAGITILSTSCFAASFLLLLCLRPNRAAFVGVCKKCKTPIPIAFVDYGSCPSCDESLHQLL